MLDFRKISDNLKDKKALAEGKVRLSQAGQDEVLKVMDRVDQLLHSARAGLKGGSGKVLAASLDAMKSGMTMMDDIMTGKGKGDHYQ